jgi:uncharacterized C2H2 Zn-finger protein
MTELPEPAVTNRSNIELLRCSRCSIRVRRDEIDVHLAHAHNVGPTPSKKEKGGRDRGRRSS